MSPQKRYTLFSMAVADTTLLKMEPWEREPATDNRGGERGTIVIVQVLARSRAKALKKIFRLYEKPKHEFIRTCFTFADYGLSAVELVREKIRRTPGDWVSFEDIT